MMTPEIAQAAIQFMMRVQLTGQEVPAFNAVMQALHETCSDAKKEADPLGTAGLTG